MAEPTLGPGDFETPDDSLELNQMLDLYDQQVQAEKQLRKDYEQAKERREALEESLFVTLENSGLQSVKNDNGTFFRRIDTYCSIKKGEQARAYEWLKSHKLDDIIQPTVNSRTLTATLKEWQDQGNEIPEDFINVTTKNRVGIRR